MKADIFDVTAEDNSGTLIQFEIVLNEFAERDIYQYAKNYLNYLNRDIEQLFISSCQFCHSENIDNRYFLDKDFFIRPIQGCIFLSF